MPISLRQIAETAAFASARSAFLLEDRMPVSQEHLQNYWKCCRGRMLDWLRRLETLSGEANCVSPDEHLAMWESARPLVDEILVTDVLTRVWATVLVASDLNRGSRDATPIARHTFNGHLDARNRALRLVLHDLQLPISEVARVDRLRRKAERWTDILIGHLTLNFQLDEFAHDPERAVEFGEGQIREILQATDEPLWEFVLTGIRLAFAQQQDAAPSEAWNQSIVRSVLGSFPADSFDEFGTFKGIRRVRIERGTAGSDRVLEALSLAMDNDRTKLNRGQISFAKMRQRFSDQ
jgi:hypothetical protein